MERADVRDLDVSLALRGRCALEVRSRRLALTVWATVVGTFLVLPSARGAELPPRLQDLLREAQDLQAKGEYARAWEKYHQIRKAEHNPPEAVTKGCQECLRKVQQYRRLRDKESQALLADLSHSDSLEVYVKALDELQHKYFDESKVGLGDLFQYGVQEFRLALEDDAFLKDQVRPDARPAVMEALKDRLAGLRASPPTLEKPGDAYKHLQSVMLSAGGLGIKPRAVLVEFLSGACNALDEYTGYLSPSRLAEIDADLEGKFVGIGVDVAIVSSKGKKQLLISEVYPGSPAEKEGLRDHLILSIDGQKPDPATPGALVAKLEGEAGTTVVLEVVPLGAPASEKRKVKVARQPVAVPSVIYSYSYETGIAYIKIKAFNETTPQDLQSALLLCRSNGMKGLILDLRGNLGGSFKAAIQVAEQFLPDGVIVYTQFRTKEKAWRANNPDALTVPMVVLVDGDTASAAEVVAGALKDHKRAELVGQPTYGKGSIQTLVRLKSLKAALQVTVARFSSPDRVSYDGHGITPDYPFENVVSMSDDPRKDPQREEALRRLKMKMVGMPMPMMPNMPPMPM
jgi:carboxyl-terminal processing protease